MVVQFFALQTDTWPAAVFVRVRMVDAHVDAVALRIDADKAVLLRPCLVDIVYVSICRVSFLS